MLCPIVNSYMDNQREPERAYREAVYSVEIPGGTIEFHPGEAVPQLAGQPFALITGYNPGAARPGVAANEAANLRLRARLVAAGFPFRPAAGASPDRQHVEPSFAVFGISRHDALALARDFGQAAIVWFDGAVTELAWTSEAPGSRAT